MLVTELPIRFGEAFEPDRGSPGLDKRKTGNCERHNSKEEQERQRKATLSNGLQQCQPPATIPHLLNNALGLLQPMSQKPKTVLIVDDDEGMRDTLTAILKRDYRVLKVGTGEA